MAANATPIHASPDAGLDAGLDEAVLAQGEAIHATAGAGAADTRVRAPDRATALLKQAALDKLTTVPAQLHKAVACAGTNCKYKGIIPAGTMPLIACQGACIADWTGGRARRDAPNLRAALDFVGGDGGGDGQAVGGFRMRPGYRGACVFCPDCYGRGAHKVESTKPGVPDQCVACVKVYAEEEAGLERAATNPWKLKELQALKKDGMVCFPLLPLPLPAPHLRDVNDLAHNCADAAEELKDFELEAAGGRANGESARGDMLYMKHNFNLTGQELGTLLDVLHARMGEEADLKVQLAHWSSAHPRRMSAADAACYGETAGARRNAAVARTLRVEDSDDDDDDDDPRIGGADAEAEDGGEADAGADAEAAEAAEADEEALTDLRQRLQAASAALAEAKAAVEAKAAELGDAKEKLDAASTRAAKSTAAAAAAGARTRPKPKSRGTSNGGSSAKKRGGGSGGGSGRGASKTISKKAHAEVVEKFKQQRYQSKKRWEETQRQLAVIAAERKWINGFLDAHMASAAEAAAKKKEFAAVIEGVEATWRLQGEKNPDDEEFDPAAEDSDDESDDDGDEENLEENED